VQHAPHAVTPACTRQPSQLEHEAAGPAVPQTRRVRTPACAPHTVASWLALRGRSWLAKRQAGQALHARRTSSCRVRPTRDGHHVAAVHEGVAVQAEQPQRGVRQAEHELQHGRRRAAGRGTFSRRRCSDQAAQGPER
jgi:hypothetical protein